MKTFCITVCNWRAKFLPAVSEIYKTKRVTFIYCLSFQFFFPYVPQNVHGHFLSYFQNGYTQSSEAAFAFYCIKLSHQCRIYCQLMFTPKFQYTTKLAPHVPQNVHFKIRCYIDKIQKLANSKIFYRCD